MVPQLFSLQMQANACQSSLERELNDWSEYARSAERLCASPSPHLCSAIELGIDMGIYRENADNVYGKVINSIPLNSL